MFLIFWNFEIQSRRSIAIAYFAAMHHLNFCTCKIKLSTETPKSTYRTSWFDKKVQSILVDRPAPNTFYVVGPLNFFLEKKKNSKIEPELRYAHVILALKAQRHYLLYAAFRYCHINLIIYWIFKAFFGLFWFPIIEFSIMVKSR